MKLQVVMVSGHSYTTEVADTMLGRAITSIMEADRLFVDDGSIALYTRHIESIRRLSG